MNLPSTVDRVPESTSERINERIRRRTAERIEFYRDHPDEIDDRLEELDREWDIERTLEANASALILITLALGMTKHRKFLVFPAVIAGLLFQHAIQGWCPPIPVLRRLGIRTQREISEERHALRAIQNEA